MPGDYAALEHLMSKVSQFEKGNVTGRVVKAIANEALTQSQMCFRESRDPYGNAWAPLKSRKGKPLLLTGRLRSSLAIEVTDRGFRLGSNVFYAVFHQQGVDKTFTRKARTQVALRRAGGARGGQFVKLNTKAHGSKLTATTSHFGARAMHLVIPRRQFIPDGGNLGSIWSKAFVEAGNLALTRIIGNKL